MAVACPCCVPRWARLMKFVTQGTILFIEDRAERPYRIDRMLMQLKLAGKFDGVRGIIFGEMIDCGEPGALDYTLQQVVMRILGDLADSDCVWPEVRARVEWEHHAAVRGAGDSSDGCVSTRLR